MARDWIRIKEHEKLESRDETSFARIEYGYPQPVTCHWWVYDYNTHRSAAGNARDEEQAKCRVECQLKIPADQWSVRQQGR